MTIDHRSWTERQLDRTFQDGVECLPVDAVLATFEHVRNADRFTRDVAQGFVDSFKPTDPVKGRER